VGVTSLYPHIYDNINRKVGWGICKDNYTSLTWLTLCRLWKFKMHILISIATTKIMQTDISLKLIKNLKWDA
jgi:hypothetical protein